MAHDELTIAKTHNTARFFTENRHVAWVLLGATLLWGVFGYLRMPKLKDPEVPVTLAAAVVVWPGASAERVEQLVARRLEEKIAENSQVTRIESISRSSIAVVLVKLDERVADTGREFVDITQKLPDIHNKK
jgi:multidrug efflux pump subunit AcrB